jgi:hypothetical protein
MKMKIPLLATLLHVLSLVQAAPARSNSDSNPGLRGSESLVGYSPSEPSASKSAPDIKYTLLPGQKEDPNIGSYLDFEKADNPQPIRGSSGGDDPGPSTFAWKYLILSRILMLILGGSS